MQVKAKAIRTGALTDRVQALGHGAEDFAPGTRADRQAQTCPAVRTVDGYVGGGVKDTELLEYLRCPRGLTGIS